MYRQIGRGDTVACVKLEPNQREDLRTHVVVRRSHAGVRSLVPPVSPIPVRGHRQQGVEAVTTYAGEGARLRPTSNACIRSAGQ